MRTRSAVLATVGLGAAVVVGGAGWAAARDDGAPATGWRRDFVCAHASELQQDQATRLQLVTSTATLAGEAKSAAEAAGDTNAVDRLTKRLTAATNRQGRMTTRQQKLADYAAKN